ncbi:MAG: peptidase M23/M37 family [Candidatus Saganbacteria bacterium]|uniref:Peptidase M23/M37 family n=1 Tax=Candidatus Saganbacteria bacterium TaxID=2575572 RepID=A0A833KZQ5_UNCSA|nr:MAG: peptidase M23/M37 family [Candidatus Saganbacteria bacterium]
MKRISAFIYLLLIFSIAHSETRIVAHSQVFQGRSFIVFLRTAESDSKVKEVFVSFNGKKIPFFSYEGGLRAIIGTMPEEKPGDYPLEIELIKDNGEKEVFEQSIDVAYRNYPKVSFWLKPAKKKLLTADVIAEEWAKIEEKILKLSEDKLWDGFFIKPVPGITTMPFGMREFINNKVAGRHRGWDFRAKVGTPVKSAQNGVVRVAEFFKSFGGTVVVDHGQGINTLYFHLSKINAEPGQKLSKGEIIGLSGNTGISSGPHLHWGMSVHNIRVDPMQWVNTIMP